MWKIDDTFPCHLGVYAGIIILHPFERGYLHWVEALHQEVPEFVFPSCVDGSLHGAPGRCRAGQAWSDCTKVQQQICISGLHASIVETEGASKKLENSLTFLFQRFSTITGRDDFMEERSRT